MSVSEFLEGLPSYNETNFSKYHVESNSRSPFKKPSVYVPTKDFPSEQIIVTEKTSILLKYMQTHWDKKQKQTEHSLLNSTKKRENTTETDDSSRKRPRLGYPNP